MNNTTRTFIILTSMSVAFMISVSTAFGQSKQVVAKGTIVQEAPSSSQRSASDAATGVTVVQRTSVPRSRVKQFKAISHPSLNESIGNPTPKDENGTVILKRD